jgi:hypothetical protein
LHFSCSRIDPPQIALVAFPGTVPHLAIDPGDAGDKAVGVDGAKDCSGLRIDLVNLPLPILTYPERALAPSESRVTAAAGRRDRCEQASGLWIDLVDAALDDLE